MAKENVSESIKDGLTEADLTVQVAQKEGEALLAGIQALICAKDGVHAANLRNAAALCVRLDTVLFSLMNDVNCIAEKHGANYIEVPNV